MKKVDVEDVDDNQSERSLAAVSMLYTKEMFPKKFKSRRKKTKIELSPISK